MKAACKGSFEYKRYLYYGMCRHIDVLVITWIQNIEIYYRSEG